MLSPALDLRALLTDRLVVVACPPSWFDPSRLQELGARDVLYVSRARGRSADCDVEAFQSLSDIGRNNCDLAILNGAAVLATINKRYFSTFKHILVPMNGWSLASAAGLARYGRRGLLQFAGWTSIQQGGHARNYIVLENRASRAVISRQYGPRRGIIPFLRSLSTVDYVLLRSIEEIESPDYDGDVDILVSPRDVNKLAVALNNGLGTRPFDVYTAAGELGYSYHGVPCFKPSFAEKVLANSEVRASGVRAPSLKWRYLAFCYHVLFHDKLTASAAAQDDLEPGSFRKPRHFDALHELARQAGFLSPRQISDLEAALRAEDAFPGLDLISFYALRSEFARRRYLKDKELRPGLGVFFLRDFGAGIETVPTVRMMLAEKFSIVLEGPVTDANRSEILGGVRGGNWRDSSAPDGVALPVYWFVCWDQSPLRPSLRMRWKYPNLDNANLRMKRAIRAELGTVATKHKPQSIVHSSDNTMEAIEHLRHIGIADHAAIKALGLEPRAYCSIASSDNQLSALG